GAPGSDPASVEFFTSHLILEEGQPFVAKRMIHVDVDLAVLAARGILDADPAAKIFWDVRAAINFVGGFEKRHGERLVIAFRTKIGPDGVALDDDFLSSNS